jgi:hypothetical protein
VPNCDPPSQRFAESGLGQDRGIHTTSERSDLVDRRIDLVTQRANHFGTRRVITRKLVSCDRELDPKGNQALLGAVVKVTLELEAFAVLDRAGTGPGFRQRFERGTELAAEVVVLQRSKGIGPGAPN